MGDEMKKYLILIALLLLVPVSVFATGSSITQTVNYVRDENNHVSARTLTFIITGDGTNGSIANTDTSAANTLLIVGWRLVQVEAFPTSGGTAPDAADVMIYTSNGRDLLGSEDGGTTAYQGLNLIHATLARAVIPDLYIPRAGVHQPYFPIITGTLTLDVDNQGTASANWTIVLTFER